MLLKLIPPLSSSFVNYFGLLFFFFLSGVEISATSILGLSPVNIQDGGIQTFQFDVALDSVAGAGSVRGNSLWLVTAFASSSSDGSIRVGEQQRILLSADVSGTSIFAGSRSILENLVVTLNFQNLNCAQLRYFCVEVMRNPDGTPFTLTGVPNDDVLTTCQELNCGGETEILLLMIFWGAQNNVVKIVQIYAV